MNRIRKQKRLYSAGCQYHLKYWGKSKAGWPATSAAALFANAKSRADECICQRAGTARLIPLGQTNAPEFGFKNVTDPVLYGPTRNPWQSAYSAGDPAVERRPS